MRLHSTCLLFVGFGELFCLSVIVSRRFGRFELFNCATLLTISVPDHRKIAATPAWFVYGLSGLHLVAFYRVLGLVGPSRRCLFEGSSLQDARHPKALRR